MAGVPPAAADPPKRSLRRLREVGNGRETYENAAVSRFYTAWSCWGQPQACCWRRT